MFYEKDLDGDYWGCINCGKTVNINFNKGVKQTASNPMWGNNLKVIKNPWGV